MRQADLSVVASTLLLITLVVGRAQSPSQRNPDVSNKALITKSTPGISADAFKNKSANTTDALRKMAGSSISLKKGGGTIKGKIKDDPANKGLSVDMGGAIMAINPMIAVATDAHLEHPTFAVIEPVKSFDDEAMIDWGKPSPEARRRGIHRWTGVFSPPGRCRSSAHRAGHRRRTGGD